jgi:hypothetical protein
MDDRILWVLLAIGVGYIVYMFGKGRGYNNGYDQAQSEAQQWIHRVTVESASLQSDNARLSQENGSLRKENDIVKNLLRQQPPTPQAEAILKSLQRVELRLVEALPSVLDDGEDHQTQLN